MLVATMALAAALLSPDRRALAQGTSPIVCAERPDAPPEAIIEACTAKLESKDISSAHAADALMVRAAMRVRQGHSRQAIDDLTQAVGKRGNDAAIFVRRAALYQVIADDDRAISDLSEAIKLEPAKAQYVFDRAELFRKKGDRRRAFIDYGAVLKLDPAFEGAAGHRKALSREIEKIGAMMPVALRPSFDCGLAKRAVEKAICADLELSELDRDMDVAFQQAMAKAVAQQAAVIQTEQDSFLATRNMSFGQAGYDLKRAMIRRLAALRSQAN